MGHPEYVPQLATLVRSPPSGPQWLHEIKYDGYRIGALIRAGAVRLLSRTGKDWTAEFPEIAASVRALGVADALIDGEVAAVLPDGRTSFQALQHARSGGDRALVYFAFDLLRLDGTPLDTLPLETRKARLGALLRRGARDSRLRYSDHVEGNGAAFFDRACEMRLEGIISKQRHLPYRPGRHASWTKTKCTRRQEFVIGGFTDPEGSRMGLGALLVGWYDGARLVFCGKVGTGFTHAAALELRRRLEALAQPAPAFDPPPPRPIARKAHWVAPALVCEVAFTEWTGDGMIRHPSFQGLREDKRPQDVRREEPAPPPAPPARTAARRQAPVRHPAPARSDRRTTAASTGTVDVAGIRITHPDRVVYPRPSLTKADLARYYERIADWVVPHVAGRPLTLVRCPEGIDGGCFYMKHSKTWTPDALRHVRIREKTKTGDYLVADDIAGIVGLVQMGVLEIHTWNTLAGDVERPNRLVFDLDPGEGVEWPQVVRAARTVRKALESLDLESYPKTTGGRGLHVVVPLVPHAEWTDCLAFTRALSEALEQANPGAYTTRLPKRARIGRILIDYLRNNRANTSIAAFSTRARDGAPVSLPLTWEDLRPSLRPDRFTPETVPRRLARLQDPWKGYWASRQKLTGQRLRAVRGGLPPG